MEMRKGDVLCFENQSNLGSYTVGNIISFAEKIGNLFKRKLNLPIRSSKIVHTALVLDENYYVEAIMTGVTVRPVEKLKNKSVWLCSLNDEMRKKLKDNEGAFDVFISKQIGKPYDFMQLFKFLPYLFTGRLFFQPDEDTRLNVCSELVAATFEAAGMIQENVSAVTPSDIYRKDWYKIRTKV